jgi:hypothetical protein
MAPYLDLEGASGLVCSGLEAVVFHEFLIANHQIKTRQGPACADPYRHPGMENKIQSHCVVCGLVGHAEDKPLFLVGEHHSHRFLCCHCQVRR